ncbi:MAG: Rrf2 family transcriptional regulator [FCB group bacterium]|nr:Rrf2 family transcriptional regulator [FCB group bacterium]
MIYPQTVIYALEALCHLARLSPKAYHKVKDISSELDIPPHFLGKILTQLVRKKLIVSSKGPTGGVALAKAPGRITIQDVLKALDAQDILDDKCILGLEECSDHASCPFHKEWARFKKGIASVAGKTTLKQLAEK